MEAVRPSRRPSFLAFFPSLAMASRVLHFRAVVTVSDRIVPGLQLPGGVGPIRAEAKIGTPLPIPELLPDVVDPLPALYSIVKVDSSGRVADNTVMTALSWPPGAPLDFRVAGTAIIVRHVPGGLYNRSTQACFTIPSRIRQRCRIAVGDRVILTAVPRRDLVIVTSVRVLHDALSDYHRAILSDGSARDD
jgi:hypothetical protein